MTAKEYVYDCYYSVRLTLMPAIPATGSKLQQTFGPSHGRVDLWLEPRLWCNPNRGLYSLIPSQILWSASSKGNSATI